MNKDMIPSAHIRYEEIGGELIILDLQTTMYFIIDRVGTSMWHHWLQLKDQDAVLLKLQERYPVDPVRLKKDLEAFLQRCLAKGFLQTEIRDMEPEAARESEPLMRSRPKRCLTIRAWWCLFRTVRDLSSKGFSRTYRAFDDLPWLQVSPVRPEDLLGRAVGAFVRAENFFFIKRAPKDCVPRSLALFRFLRSVGLPVEHCIGVCRYPFKAHAWVEYQGRVVGDAQSQALMFKVLARVKA